MLDTWIHCFWYVYSHCCRCCSTRNRSLLRYTVYCSCDPRIASSTSTSASAAAALATSCTASAIRLAAALPLIQFAIERTTENCTNWKISHRQQQTRETRAQHCSELCSPRNPVNKCSTNDWVCQVVREIRLTIHIQSASQSDTHSLSSLFNCVSSSRLVSSHLISDATDGSAPIPF